MCSSIPQKKTVLNLVSREEECEELLIRWEIKDFPKFLKRKREEMHRVEVVFETGESIGRPAKWIICFTRSDECSHECREFSLGFVIRLIKANPPPVDAFFSITLKNGDKVIWEGSQDDRKEYDLTSFKLITFPNLKNIMAGVSNIKVCINVKTFKKTMFLPVLQKGREFDSEIFGQKLVQDFSNFFHKMGKGDGDVSISVPSENGSYSVKAHKAILSARSNVFEAMFDPEKKMLEGEKGEVLIPDLSPLSLRVLLEYIYTGKVSEEWEQVPGEVMNAAEKYALPELKEFCGQGLVAIGNNNMTELLELARLHNISDAQEELGAILNKIG